MRRKAEDKATPTSSEVTAPDHPHIKHYHEYQSPGLVHLLSISVSLSFYDTIPISSTTRESFFFATPSARSRDLSRSSVDLLVILTVHHRLEPGTIVFICYLSCLFRIPFFKVGSEKNVFRIILQCYIDRRKGFPRFWSYITFHELLNFAINVTGIIKVF